MFFCIVSLLIRWPVVLFGWQSQPNKSLKCVNAKSAQRRASKAQLGIQFELSLVGGLSSHSQRQLQSSAAKNSGFCAKSGSESSVQMLTAQTNATRCSSRKQAANQNLTERRATQRTPSCVSLFFVVRFAFCYFKSHFLRFSGCAFCSSVDFASANSQLSENSARASKRKKRATFRLRLASRDLRVASCGKNGLALLLALCCD